MNRGYVKLWRKGEDSAVFQDAHLFQLWSWCLWRAAWQPTKWETVRTGRGNTLVELNPGEFIFGRKSAAKAVRQPEGSIRHRMKKLELLGNITVKVTTHYSIVSIVNWHTYQSSEDGVDHPTVQPTANQRPTNGHEEEGKEVKALKKKSNGHFVPPTIDQVRERIAERRISVDPERFVAHYQSNGWMVGKNKMKCWDSALTTWSKNPTPQQQPIWGRPERL